MPDDKYRTFLALSDAPVAGSTRIPVLEKGKYKDRRYGDFTVDDQLLDELIANHEKVMGGKILIDADHQADRTTGNRNTAAMGWGHRLEKDGNVLWLHTNLTPKGRQAIGDQEYLKTSAVYGTDTDEHGVTHKNVLKGVSFTNRPFLKGLPAISLMDDDLARKLAQDDDETVAGSRELEASPAPVMAPAGPLYSVDAAVEYALEAQAAMRVPDVPDAAPLAPTVPELEATVSALEAGAPETQSFELGSMSLSPEIERLGRLEAAHADLAAATGTGDVVQDTRTLDAEGEPPRFVDLDRAGLRQAVEVWSAAKEAGQEISLDAAAGQVSGEVRGGDIIPTMGVVHDGIPGLGTSHHALDRRIKEHQAEHGCGGEYWCGLKAVTGQDVPNGR